MSEISIIVPAYNEGKRIESTLKSLFLTFPKEEIIVVSNGSVDNTVEILKRWKEKNSNLKYLDFPEKLGKGGAIIEGLKLAEGDWVGFVDADDAFDLSYIKNPLNNLHDYDCFIASKWKGKNIFQVNEPMVRKILSRGWNILVLILLDLNYHDTQAGAKFFKNTVKEKIGYNFISSGFAFDVELLKKIEKNNFRIKEIYIPSKFVDGSTFKLKHCKTMFKDLIKIWRSK
ncbi:glycosyltransferase [Candidatus Woesearchaeota archaeon]|nr:glycosyltransferase [Candidatus Woesearchaeota archaeon]